MSNPSKAKGRDYEREIARSIGADTTRTALSGAHGGGDVTPGRDTIWTAWSFELKRREKLPLRFAIDALDQAQSDIAINDPRSAILLMREDNGRSLAVCYWDDLRLFCESLAEVGQAGKLRQLRKQAADALEAMRRLL